MTMMQPTSRRRQRQSGVAIVLLSLMLCTVLLPMIGLAFDLTIMYIVRAKLSAAVDAGVLAGGRSLIGSKAVSAQQAQVSQIAQDFLAANMPAGYWGTSATPTVETPSTSIVTQDALSSRIYITLQASVQVPLVFLQYLQNTALVRSSAVASRRFLRMVIVLDRSNSMADASACTRPNCPIDELIAAVSNTDPNNLGFVQQFSQGADQLGLIVFSGSAMVAYPPRDPTGAIVGTGPDPNFLTNSSPAIPDLVPLIKPNGYTGTAEAITLAYKELQKNPQQLYYNVIVLFTDGWPNAITASWNGAAPTPFYSGDSLNTATNPSTIKSTSACTYKATSYMTTNPMVGWLGMWEGIYAPLQTTPFSPWNASSTPAADVKAWLASDDDALTNTQSGTYAVTVNVKYPANSQGCAFYNTIVNDQNTHGSTQPTPVTDVNNMPAGDVYGNAALGTDYKQSVEYHNTSLALQTAPPQNGGQGDQGYLWGWNLTYQAGLRIRQDSTLKPTIYCIGYLGDGGVDRGLLKRLTNTNNPTEFTANDWNDGDGGDSSGPYPSSAYISGQTSGMYYDAGPGGIAAAFQQVKSQILSLAM